MNFIFKILLPHFSIFQGPASLISIGSAFKHLKTNQSVPIFQDLTCNYRPSQVFDYEPQAILGITFSCLSFIIFIYLTLLVPTGGIIRPAPKENLCHIFIGRNFFFNLWWLFKFKPLTNLSKVRFFFIIKIFEKFAIKNI